MVRYEDCLTRKHPLGVTMRHHFQKQMAKGFDNASLQGCGQGPVGVGKITAAQNGDDRDQELAGVAGYIYDRGKMQVAFDRIVKGFGKELPGICEAHVNKASLITVFAGYGVNMTDAQRLIDGRLAGLDIDTFAFTAKFQPAAYRQDDNKIGIICSHGLPETTRASQVPKDHAVVGTVRASQGIQVKPPAERQFGF